MEVKLYSKIVIILLFNIFCTQPKLHSQVPDRDTIIQLIEQNKLECYDFENYYNSQCLERWVEVFLRIQNNFFNPDSALVQYFAGNKDYIFYTSSNQTLYTDQEEYYDAFYLKKYFYNDYLLSSTFKDSSYNARLDFALSHNKKWWLKNLARQLTIQEIVNLFIYRGEKSTILLDIVNNRDTNDWLLFYSSVISLLRSQVPTYGTFISLITEKKNSQLDSIFIIEKSYFENNRDTTNSLHNFIWDHKFTRNAIVRDSIKNAEWERKKAIRNDSIREAMLKEQLEPPTEEEYLATLDSTKKVQYFASRDTTLWYDGSIFTGDDGTNFNTWSNDSLLLKLRSLNPDSLYVVCNKKLAQMNGSIPVFHLRKICQIIGDRILNGSLVLSPDDSVFLHQLVEYYASQYADTLNYRHHFDLTEESKVQLLRLWPLLPAHIISWIERPEFMYHALAAGMLVCLFNEDLVDALIYKMDHPANATELAMKRSYFDMLELLYFYKEPSAESHGIFLPPRRPLRNYQQTQDWIDRLIEPARIRHGISEVK